MSSTLPSRRFWLSFALLSSLLVYAPLLNSYFCGYDDFTELRQAAFEDAVEPMRMITTSHHGTPKYRPLNRILTWSCYKIGGGAAWIYRWRNVLCQLASAAAIFHLALLMGLPVAGAGLTAAAFGMHPLAHQSVAAASWSNSAAYAFVLWSWYFLASSWRSNKPLGRILAGVLLLFLAVFAYEATIVVLGPLTLDLFWRRFRKESPAAGWPKFLLPWILGVGFVVILLAIARMAFAVGKMPLTPPVMIVKNFILYFGALVLPVDMLMLNSVAGFPLPSQFVQDSSALLKLGLIAGIPVLLLLVLLYRYRRSIPLPLDSWAWMWLLAIPMALSPFLLNTSHASETYNYLPVALWCLWVAGRLSAWVQPKVAASAAAVILLLLAGETLLRSNRVRACAATAQTIITTSPLSQWHTGQPRIFYRQRDIPADAPKYGIYAWQGLATVDAQTDMIRALEAALQVASNNPQLTAEAVDDKAFQQACKDTASQCFAVTLDGHVVPSRPPQ